MIAEIIMALGTTVGGKVFGMISDALSERRIHKHEEAEREHQRQLADKQLIGKHIEMVNAPQADGSYSPMSYVSAYCVGLFATLYCVATVSCFFWEPTALVLTKDPTTDPTSTSVLFGLFEWSASNNAILSMSKIGVGFLMLQPIIFIVSMVLTGDKARKRH